MPSVPGEINFPASLDDPVSQIEVANGVQSILVGPMTSIATAFTLLDASLFPATGIATIQEMEIVITGTQTALIPLGPLEIISWQSKAGNDLNGVLRGQQGTTAMAHNSGAWVQMRITAKHHQATVEQIRTIQAKLGIGASIAGAGQLLRGIAAGQSGWEPATFEYMQTAPAGIWTITHNLASKPSVITVDNAGGEIKGEIAYVSLNQLTITFSQAINGRAYLN